MIKVAKEDSTIQGVDTLLGLSIESPSWSNEEKCKFNEAVLHHGRDWAKVSAHVGTRGVAAVQNYSR